MNYLGEWSAGLLASRSLVVTQAVRVEGIRKAHLGPRLEFARVEFAIEPATDFTVTKGDAIKFCGADEMKFIDWAVFWFLDIVMTTESYPAKNIKLTVVAAEFDPVSSSMMAFRLAGRDAGRKFIEQVKARPPS
jgi:hypothetical protein